MFTKLSKEEVQTALTLQYIFWCQNLGLLVENEEADNGIYL